MLSYIVAQARHVSMSQSGGVRSCPSVDIGRRHYACSTARSRLAGLAWIGAPSGGSAPPDPCQAAAGCCSSGLLRAGLCAADRDAVEGFPWPGRPRGWAQLGSRSPGLRLLAAVLPPWKATQSNLHSLLRQGQASLRSVLRSLDTRSLRLGFAA